MCCPSGELLHSICAALVLSDDDRTAKKTPRAILRPFETEQSSIGDTSRTRRARNLRNGSGEEYLLVGPPPLSFWGVLPNMGFCASPAEVIWSSKSLAKGKSKSLLN